MKQLLTVSDLTPELVNNILHLADSYKQKAHQGSRFENILNGKVIAMVFEKPSLRTKVAFEVAASSLGGQPVFLSSAQILASGNNEKGRESVPDIARNLERFTDMIIARVYEHESLHVVSQHVTVPVINALCDKHHPTQSLADIHIIREKKGIGNHIKIAFIGDGNNVAVSLMQIAALTGCNFSIASPDNHQVPAEEKKIAKEMAEVSGAKIEFTLDPEEAVTNSDVVYTDTFVSMGQEDEKGKRIGEFEGYQVTSPLLKKAKDNAVFMHCLPAHRGEEVTDEVMDSPQSIIFDQAESRLHIAKALLTLMLK